MTERGILFHWSHTGARILLGIVFWIALEYVTFSQVSFQGTENGGSPVVAAVLLILPLIAAVILVAVVVRLPGIRRLRYRLVTWDQVVLTTITPNPQSLQLSFVFKGVTNKNTIHVIPSSVQFTMPRDMGPSIERFLSTKLGPERVRKGGSEPQSVAGVKGTSVTKSPQENEWAQAPGREVEWIQQLDNVTEGESRGNLYITKDRLAFVKKHQIQDPLTINEMLELDENNFDIQFRDVQQLEPHGNKLKIAYIQENRKVDKFDLKFNGRDKKNVLEIAGTLQALVNESKAK
jgi:hypothetical protein